MKVFVDSSILNTIWEKGVVVEGYSPERYRKDCCGAWMAYGKYGDTSNPFGWEVDHVFPQAKGGDDSTDNLRPMNWKNNRSKGDDYPSYQSAVIADGNKNIEASDVYTVNKELQRVLSRLYHI